MTIPVQAHRAKRQNLNPCFSKRRVHALEPVLYDELDRVFNKIDAYEQRGQEVPIQNLYHCYTGDVIWQYLFGQSLGLVDTPDFSQRVDKMRSAHFMPRWLALRFKDPWLQITLFCEDLAKKVITTFCESRPLKTKDEDETLFERVLANSEKTFGKGNLDEASLLKELADESTAILNAGTEPPATMMAYGTYFFLKHTKVQAKLLKELAGVKLDSKGYLPLKELETLPFFIGFVREIHKDPEIFEQPEEFKPERWVSEPGKKLEHWLFAFSKGGTDCIGKE
ncbi:MAG: hypothetical protein MMC23_009764 [Stictis urceolatum]|nr:hypothetical protein [Stictis urceolata]